jgi:hypothetical protein
MQPTIRTLLSGKMSMLNFWILPARIARWDASAAIHFPRREEITEGLGEKIAMPARIAFDAPAARRYSAVRGTTYGKLLWTSKKCGAGGMRDEG